MRMVNDKPVNDEPAVCVVSVKYVNGVKECMRLADGLSPQRNVRACYTDVPVTEVAWCL